MKIKIVMDYVIYKKFLSIFLKKGLKSIAYKLLTKILLHLIKETGHSFSYLVWNFFNKLQTKVEIRKVIIKGNSFLVPFKIKLHRQIYLITKWFVQILLEQKKQQAQQFLMIITELLLLYADNKKESKLLKYHRENNKQVYLNRANLHYRW